jgi:hypothetical protein
VIRRWKYLVVGVNNEDDASALAEAIGQEIPAKASVHIQAVPLSTKAPAWCPSPTERPGTPSRGLKVRSSFSMCIYTRLLIQVTRVA